MQACDAHFHVFGPEERYPYSSELRYAPPSAPLEDYLEHGEMPLDEMTRRPGEALAAVLCQLAPFCNLISE